MSTSSLNTWSCIHLCLPCVKEALQDDTRFRMPLFHKAHCSCFLLGPICIGWLVMVADHAQTLIEKEYDVVQSANFLPISASSLLL